jgi:hypothetical protein
MDGQTERRTERRMDWVRNRHPVDGRTEPQQPRTTDRQAPRHTHIVPLHNRQTDRLLATHTASFSITDRQTGASPHIVPFHPD